MESADEVADGDQFGQGDPPGGVHGRQGEHGECAEFASGPHAHGEPVLPHIGDCDGARATLWGMAVAQSLARPIKSRTSAEPLRPALIAKPASRRGPKPLTRVIGRTSVA